MTFQLSKPVVRLKASSMSNVARSLRSQKDPPVRNHLTVLNAPLGSYSKFRYFRASRLLPSNSSSNFTWRCCANFSSSSIFWVSIFGLLGVNKGQFGGQNMNLELWDCSHRICRQILRLNTGLTFPPAQHWKISFFWLKLGSIRAN